MGSRKSWTELTSLVGGSATPLKNISQLGWLFPIYGKIKNVPNHQPVVKPNNICRCKWLIDIQSCEAWTCGSANGQTAFCKVTIDSCHPSWQNMAKSNFYNSVTQSSLTEMKSQWCLVQSLANASLCRRMLYIFNIEAWWSMWQSPRRSCGRSHKQKSKHRGLDEESLKSLWRILNLVFGYFWIFLDVFGAGLLNGSRLLSFLKFAFLRDEVVMLWGEGWGGVLTDLSA